MSKRVFDIICSAVGLLILSPFLLIMAVFVKLSSPGSIFFNQTRIGKNGKPFQLVKFRTMHTGSHRNGLLTIGDQDRRITRIGKFLRKYKLDELPQLWNVLHGEMSIVGPRPEVAKYVALYTLQQRDVLLVKPGISDFASITFVDENQLLGRVNNPENYYIHEILPKKLSLNLKYIESQSFFTDLKIIWFTIKALFR